MNLTLVVALGVIVVACALAISGFRIIREHERGLVFRLGRLDHMAAPGPHFVLPFGLDRLVRVDTRTLHLDVPPTEVTTVDRVRVSVRLTGQYQIVYPQLALTKVVDHRDSTRRSIQAALRSTAPRVSLQQLLRAPRRVSARIVKIVEPELEVWGVRLTGLEVGQVDIGDGVGASRAADAPAAAAATAETERTPVRPPSTATEPEAQEPEPPNQAPDLAGALQPAAPAPPVTQPSSPFSLRQVEALSELGPQRGAILVIPMSLDLVQPLLDLERQGRDAQQRDGKEPGRPPSGGSPDGG